MGDINLREQGEKLAIRNFLYFSSVYIFNVVQFYTKYEIIQIDSEWT